MSNVLVAGEILFDIFAENLNEKGHMPMTAKVGGSCANVAIGLARLDANISFLGALPDNFLGRQLREFLQKELVDTTYVIEKPAQLPLAFVSLNNGHPQYSFYAEKTCEQNITLEDLPAPEVLFNCIHVASYPLTINPTGDAFYHLVKSHKGSCLISYDPNIRLSLQPDLAIWKRQIERFVQIADVVKVSSEDLQCVYQTNDYDAIIKKWMEAGASLVVLTDGGEGAYAFHKCGQFKQSSFAVDVQDTVGAGDSFQAAMLYKLQMFDCLTASDISQLTPLQIQDILKFSAAAAAITCTRQGPDLPVVSELNQFLEE